MLSAISFFQMITPSNGVNSKSVRSESLNSIATKSIPQSKPQADSVEISAEAKKLAGQELSKEDQEQVEKLKKRDLEVRNHEQSHMAAAGPYAKGGPKYEFQNGPDQKQYAVGGHVNIDTSKTGDPEKDLAKAQVIRSAATAVSDPSPADRSVAASAATMEAEARKKLSEQTSQGNYNSTQQKNPYQNGVVGMAVDFKV